MTRVLPRAFVRAQLASAYGDPERLMNVTFEPYHDLMLAPGARAAMIATMEQTVISDPFPVLARINVPTLLLWGERDSLIPFSNAADYLKALPNARLVSFPKLGHIPGRSDRSWRNRLRTALSSTYGLTNDMIAFSPSYTHAPMIERGGLVANLEQVVPRPDGIGICFARTGCSYPMSSQQISYVQSRV